jgi:hypothetical protein
MRTERPDNQDRVIITPSAESRIPTLPENQRSVRPVAISGEVKNVRFGTKSKIAGILLMVGIGFGAGTAAIKYHKEQSNTAATPQASADLMQKNPEEAKEIIKNPDAQAPEEEIQDAATEAQMEDAAVDTPEKLAKALKEQNLQLTAEDFDKYGAEQNRYLRAMILRPEVEIAGNPKYGVEDKIQLRWYPLAHQRGAQVQPWEINRPGFRDRETTPAKKSRYADYYNAYIVATFVSVQKPVGGAGLKPMGIAPEITWVDDKDPRISYHLGRCKEKPSEQKSSFAYVEYKFADGKYQQFNTTFITIDAGQCVAPAKMDEAEE